MTSKELISELANRLGKTQKEVSQLLETTVSVMKDEFVNDNSVSFHGFGVFDVRKKEERITKNPMTQKRMLVPPKLVLGFKPSVLFKDKLKEIKPENE